MSSSQRAATADASLVFGSNVFIENTVDANAAQGGCGGGERRPVRIAKSANVLDHCTMMPGAAVGEGAVLGSSTLGAQDSTYPPYSVSTGNVGGRSVLLQRRSAAAAALAAGVPFANTEEQRMMLAAKARHASFWWWGRIITITGKVLDLKQSHRHTGGGCLEDHCDDARHVNHHMKPSFLEVNSIL